MQRDELPNKEGKVEQAESFQGTGGKKSSAEETTGSDQETPA